MGADAKKSKPKTAEQIAAAAGAKFLDSKLDKMPDENDLSELCEIGPGDDSLAVVRACVPVAEAASWVVGCRRRAADREADGHDEPIGDVTLAECNLRMKQLAAIRERAAKPSTGKGG